VRASVIFNYRLSPSYLHLGLAAPGFPPVFRAGEFVMLRPAWGEDPLLPRAFSIYRVSGDGPRPGSAAGPAPLVEILYKVLGKGTQCLSRLRPGDEVEILGPLGNAFRTPAGITTAVLVAGGIGVPPIAALAAEIGTGHGARGTGQGEQATTAEIAPMPHAPCPTPQIEIFLGGKTAEDILCGGDFEAAGGSVHVATEDGSRGARGLVTDLVRPFLSGRGAAGVQVYACGPAGMLEAVGRLAESLAVPCQLSLEANMACGFGACMGCAVPVRGPEPRYKLCCKEGPVFEASEVAWE
jgi:dihydroorotate dehydrogenase electron transfer subunit